MIENDLWLCAFNNDKGGTWEEAYTACNQEGNFNLATVTSFTSRGAPVDSNIETAMNWAQSHSFSFVLTGQPTRSATWNDDQSSCINGLGFISPAYKTSSGSGWKEMLDGNGNEGRSWPSAQCPISTNYRLVSLCQDASSISNACIYGHRWRVGSFENCISPSSSGNGT